MASPRRAVLSSIAKSILVPQKGSLVVDIDRNQLLVDLLTFDEVVIHTPHFGEIPFLIQTFGLDGFGELLRRNIVRLASSNTAFILSRSNASLPLNHFHEQLVIQEGSVEQCSHSLLQVSGMKKSAGEDFAGFVKTKDIPLPRTFGLDLHRQVRRDLTSNSKLIQACLARVLDSDRLAEVKLTTESVGRDVIRIDSNLKTLLGLSVEQEHAALQSLCAAVRNINHTLFNMETYEAISAFQPEDAPLLFGKIAGIVSPLNPEVTQRAFLRVLNLTDVPQLVAKMRIDVFKLLEVRRSSECAEFKAWLSTTDDISDVELDRLVRGFRAKVSSFVSSTSGKAVRLAVNSGLGLLPGYGTVLSLAEGVADMFLLDKLLPSSGILTFLDRSVPSIFQSR